MSLTLKKGRMYKATGGAIWMAVSLNMDGIIELRLVRPGLDQDTRIRGSGTPVGSDRTFKIDGSHYWDSRYYIIHEVVP